MSPDRGALRRQGRLSPRGIGIRAVAAVTLGLVVEACDWLVVTSARLTIRRDICIVGVAVAVLGGVLLFLATRDEGYLGTLKGGGMMATALSFLTARIGERTSLLGPRGSRPAALRLGVRDVPAGRLASGIRRDVR